MTETVGEQLKKAREARNLTLEQVFQAIRINPRYLQGLEQDEHDSGPSPVQVKGFLRLYADFLSLPVQPLLDAWEGKAPPEQPSAAADETYPVPAGEGTAGTPDGEEEDEAVPIEVQYAGTEEPPEPEPAEAKPSPSASQLIFIEIGQMLRERREMLGLTLADVERFTKLRQHYLTALEQGQMRSLPSLVQGRGMLSNYAGFLELDVDSILLRFAEALQQRRIENMPPAPPPSLLERARAARPTAKPPAKNGWRRLVTPDLLIGGVIVIALAGFAVWGAAQVNAMRSQAAPANATTLPIANILIETETPTALAATATPTLPAAPAPLDAAEQAAAAQEGGGSSESGEVTPTALPAIGDAPFQVYVVARQRAWLRVIVDGKTAFNGRIVPGVAYPFAGEKFVELTSGNAAALQIYYNQKDLGSLGVNGQTLSLIFNESGVVKPTAAFTSTPTQTPKPSVTPQPSPTQATPSITPFIP